MAFDRRSLEGLGILSAVVEAGSFVRAGEALGVTQSAVSRAIARLEARVGIRLFTRTARAISLTDDGRRFYESVAPHLAAIEDATIEAGGTSSQVRGRLRVNLSASISQILTPRLQPLLEQHPDLFIELVVRDRIGDLVSEGFDASIRFGQPEGSSLKSRLLLRTPIVTCASPAYIARHGMPRTPNDIENHRCVLMRDPSTGIQYGWDFVRGKKIVSVNATGQLMVNEVGPMLAACLAGQGIAQLLELMVRDHIADGRLVRVLPDWGDETYPLYAYHHSSQLVSPKVRAFLELLVDTFSVRR
jgi:DNA-binding transcriptional LysR family regulator